MARSRLSEQRARQVSRDLLSFRGWDLRPVRRRGQSFEESEYRNYPNLRRIFETSSKTGEGFGKPDFLLVDGPDSLRPVIVIETKASEREFNIALEEACFYGDACRKSGFDVLAVGVAGADEEICQVGVKRYTKDGWKHLLLHGEAIDWIPSPGQVDKLIRNRRRLEVEAEKPSDEVLNNQANRLNEILRECKIKDEYRPVYAATFLLALWQGDVNVDSSVVLSQINANSRQALQEAGKAELARSLRVDEQNTTLAAKAWEIVDILKKLNIQSFVQEHDYLGQIYETFFRYTGGNTIGQYFTPRHIIGLMAELIEVQPGDRVFDPACGTGGFLIGSMKRMIELSRRPYEEGIRAVNDLLFGIESEPSTAALCITNMILRGDGKSGIVKADCFDKTDYPKGKVDFVMMNPPFPHKKTDTPPTDFIDRGLSSLRKRGLLASIIPYSLLVRTNEWHEKLLRNNTVKFIATLPPDLFNPYASYNTAIIIIEKGVPHNGSKSFVCRIFNDGYKLKKRMRVEQEGSQLSEVLRAFRGRKAIAEFSALAKFQDGIGEWSPEAFIENAPHREAEFIEGLEEFIRKQAAFYVLHGSTLLKRAPNVNVTNLNTSLFSGSSRISLDRVKMGKIRVGDYFAVELGGKDEIEDLPDGNVPIVSTSENMNGVTAYRQARKIYEEGAITVATDGSTCTAFVQEMPFYAFYKIAVIRPKKLTKTAREASYYVAYLLSRERWRYVYARKFGKKRINNTELIMPVLDTGAPNFRRMAAIVRTTRAYPIIKSFRDAFAAKELGK